jgi:hypothetical protein
MRILRELAKVVLMCACFILFDQSAFAQEDLDSIDWQEIAQAKGAISIESKVPVEINVWSRRIYLDDNFKRTDRWITRGVYCLHQNAMTSKWKLGELKSREPYRVQLDSVLLDSIIPGHYIPFNFIILGHLTYKINGKFVDYEIVNGRVERITKKTRKRGRIKKAQDYSGLYKSEDRTWPTVDYYRRNGSIKRRRTWICYRTEVSFINWKFKKNASSH